MMRWAGRRLRVILTLVAAIVLGIVLFRTSQHYAHPVCLPPNVPLQALDARLTDIGCATIGPYRQYHGAWVDAMDSSWFHLNSATAPAADKLSQTDGWLLVNPRTKAMLYEQLPEMTAEERMHHQVALISFTGTEYRVDRPNKHGLRHFYDIGSIRAVRLVRRDFVSNRANK
jgi:hypothetical protein